MARMRIVITDDGKLSMFTQEGTFAAGKKQMEALVALLQGDGASFSSVKPAEQHKHESDHLKNTQTA